MSRLIYFLSFVAILTVVMNFSKYADEKPTQKKFNFAQVAKENQAKEEFKQKLLHPVIVEKVEEVEVTKVLVELTTPELQRGSELYKKCIVCHGKRGQGKASQNAPAIGGQYDWYVANQVNNMKNGTRINKVMNPYIARLSEQDVKDLAVYISKLPFMGKK